MNAIERLRAAAVELGVPHMAEDKTLKILDPWRAIDILYHAGLTAQKEDGETLSRFWEDYQKIKRQDTVDYVMFTVRQ